MPVHYKPTTPIVKELVDYFSQNTDFETSFLAVQAMRLHELETFKIYTIDDYVR